MALEDFTTFDIFGWEGRWLLIEAEQVDFEIRKDDDNCLYKDYGVDFFAGDFELTIEYYLNAETANGGIFFPVALTNTVAGYDPTGQNFNGFHLEQWTNVNQYAVEVTANIEYTAGEYSNTGQTLYKGVLKREGSTLTLTIYNSSEVELLSHSLTLQTVEVFRYLQVGTSWNTAETKTITGSLYRLNVVAGIASTPKSNPLFFGQDF